MQISNRDNESLKLSIASKSDLNDSRFEDSCICDDVGDDALGIISK